MLITLLFAPVFFVLGLVFGLLSPFLAIFKACKRPWSKKWHSFVSLSSRMSTDHNNLVKHGTECIESFECITPCRASGQHIQLHYYKLGHSLSVLFLLFVLTLLKVIVFAPIWTALIFGNVPQQDDLDKLNLDENSNNENDNWNDSLNHSAYGDKYGTDPGYGSSHDTPKQSRKSKSKSKTKGANNDEINVSLRNDNDVNQDITKSPASAFTSHGAYD